MNDAGGHFAPSTHLLHYIAYYQNPKVARTTPRSSQDPISDWDPTDDEDNEIEIVSTPRLDDALKKGKKSKPESPLASSPSSAKSTTRPSKAAPPQTPVPGQKVKVESPAKSGRIHARMKSKSQPVKEDCYGLGKYFESKVGIGERQASLAEKNAKQLGIFEVNRRNMY
ncbi:hypothetical protein B0H14DRAFT_3876781 [Mycena olivaceomarginata]|nr:hypothetical protein B0H14DRAFT_3876781 [Mycena olivaceomarginata]